MPWSLIVHQIVFQQCDRPIVNFISGMDDLTASDGVFTSECMAQLLLFRRQCLQLLDLQHLTWPSPDILRKYTVQDWIYYQLFTDNDSHFLPPTRYRLRLLKPLLAKIEESIIDPEEDVRARRISFFSNYF